LGVLTGRLITGHFRKGLKMDKNEANIMRLKALIELMNLSISSVAKVAGCSRPMLSRILNEGLNGDLVWAELENKLHFVIQKRRRAYFEVEAISVEQVQEIVEALKKVA